MRSATPYAAKKVVNSCQVANRKWEASSDTKTRLFKHNHFTCTSV